MKGVTEMKLCYLASSSMSLLQNKLQKRSNSLASKEHLEASSIAQSKKREKIGSR